jgi:hypothetical protein
MTNAEYLDCVEFAKAHTVKLEWIVDVMDHTFTDHDFYVHKFMTEYRSMAEDLAFVNAGLAKPFGISKPNKPIVIEREIAQIMEFDFKYPKPIAVMLCVRMLEYIKSLTPEAFVLLEMRICQIHDPEPFAYMREEPK